MKKFHRIAVLFGGPSSERDVSLASGAAVSRALRGLGYDVADVDIRGRDVELPAGIQAAFLALHGAFGEDGTLQRILADRGVPYTGSGPEASHAAFDKLVSKAVFERHGINTPRWEVLRAGQARTLALPVVVKPPREGSSVGLSRVLSEEEWAPALRAGFALDAELLVETFIAGRELTVGVVGDQVLPVVEIKPHSGFYDYAHKYTKGMTEYVCPADLPAATVRVCQELGWRTFEALGCRGLGRVDIRLSDDGVPYVLEMNTIPGFTETSLLPKAAAAAGLPFPQLCEKILNLAAV